LRYTARGTRSTCRGWSDADDGEFKADNKAGCSDIVEAETSATEAQLLEAVKLTMKLGNDLTASNDAGNTALHATAYVGFNVIARFLVEHGAVLNAKNKKGETPLKIAIGVPLSGMFYSQPATADLLRTLGGTE
jgi:hypothetical protein